MKTKFKKVYKLGRGKPDFYGDSAILFDEYNVRVKIKKPDELINAKLKNIPIYEFRLVRVK